ncbi:MAG: hypothetical protein J6Q68_00795 [Clostridia bacterium]|nr:hypothetical protein [Clostridia bacterium]
MKKIICLLLIIGCSFALFACDDGSTTQTPPPETEKLPDAEFFDMVALSDPNKITTQTTTADKATSKSYSGTYETLIADDGTVVYNYEYQYAREASLENLGELGSTAVKSGTVLYANGLYSEDNGQTWVAGAPDVDIISVKLDLNREYIGEYKMSKDGKTLTTTVSAENAAKILGISVNATSDVTIKIYTNGTYLSRISVDYSNKNATIKIDTSYNYVPAEEIPEV